MTAIFTDKISVISVLF